MPRELTEADSAVVSKLVDLLIKCGCTWFPKNKAEFLVKHGVTFESEDKIRTSNEATNLAETNAPYYDFLCSNCGAYTSDQNALSTGEVKFCFNCGYRIK